VTKTETLRLTRAAFSAACAAAPSEIERAHAAALAGERQYRGRSRTGDFRKYHPAAASADDCARLFVARWVAEYALSRNFPPPEMLHRLRPDVIACAGIAAEFGPKILAAWREKALDVEQIAVLDYCVLVK